ncbi:MAG TPA: stressosome-associated protein Prli42 [Bacilli bacterium]
MYKNKFFLKLVIWLMLASMLLSTIVFSVSFIFE